MVGLFDAGKDFQERGLARAIGADEADAFAFLEIKGDALEDGTAGEGFFNVTNFGESHGYQT